MWYYSRIHSKFGTQQEQMETLQKISLLSSFSLAEKVVCFRDFLDLLDSKTSTNSGLIEDICDGRIWKDFEASNFFSSKYNVGMMLTTDWFKPFKRSQYKVAALMLTILNLPREDRFKRKWTIIAGIATL